MKSCWIFVIIAVLSSQIALAQSEPTKSQPDAAPSSTSPSSNDLDLTTLSSDLDDLKKLLDTPVSVATVNLTAESMRKAPTIVEVISAQELRAWGYHSIDEIMNHVVGFYMLNDFIISSVAVRGVTAGLGGEGGIVKVMIDGHAVNFRPTSGAWLGSELIPISAIKNIEIIRGPASAVHGADAFLGVINVVTIDPTEEATAARLRLSGSTKGGYGDARSSFNVDRWSFLAAIGGSLIDHGPLKLPSSSPAPALPSDMQSRKASKIEDQTLSAFVKTSYNPGGAIKSVDLSFLHSGLKRDGAFASWAQLTQLEDDKAQGTVIALSREVVANRGVVGFSETLQGQWTAEFTWGGNDDPDRIETGSNLYYIERDLHYWSSTLKFDLAWEKGDLGLAGGLEYLYDEEYIGGVRRILLNGSDAQRTSADQRHILGNLGAVIQARYKIFDDKMQFTGGLRVDKHNLYGTQLTGRLAAVYSMSEDTVLKALYGSAFKAPSPYLLFTQPLGAGDVIGNKDLKPQTVHTFDLSLSQNFLSYFNWLACLSYSLLLNKAAFEPQGINQRAANVATMHVLTSELEGSFILPMGLRGSLSAEMQLGKRDNGDSGYLSQLLSDKLSVYPRIIVRSSLQQRLALSDAVNIQFGAILLWSGSRLASDNNVFKNHKGYELAPFAEVDLVASLVDLHLFSDFSTNIIVRAANVFNSRVADPGFAGFDLPRSKRSIFLTLDQGF
ncbi:MAG: TonB-dependent receptor [Deltaproteobacteria bacterium]|nr:TonB-dependent receptor [Deltaproteobacteria bacterium]